jgi:hypothetical protein
MPSAGFRTSKAYAATGELDAVPFLTLSQAIKAYAPDVAVSPLGNFVVIWPEEHWPEIKTTVQPIRLDKRH